MNNQEIINMGQKYLMNTYGRLPIALVRGEGLRVWDADGKEYLDFITGLAVNSLGHCHPRVAEAIAQQAQTLMHCSNLYWIEPQVRLAKILVDNSVLDQVFFCNSGAEANEGAIKLARKYAKHYLEGEPFEIITMQHSFHGRTLATLTATGQTKYQQGYDPLPAGFKYVPFNDLEALEDAITPATCAVMLEPVQGEGGINVATVEYLQGVKALCKKNRLLLIFDEVQCGLGRTGKMFAYEHYGVHPDIITLAKALGGGFPIGAIMAKQTVAEAFNPGDHASTFGGNPLACAAGIASLETLLDEGLVHNAAQVGQYFIQQLAALQDKFPVIMDIRGKGLMIGVELATEGKPVVDACREQGLLINCTNNYVLRFLPPLNVTVTEVDQVLEIITGCLARLIPDWKK